MSVISKETQRLLATGSTLRDMFEEGKRLAKQYGRENIYDFSLGNPNTPVPEELNDAIRQVLDEYDSLTLHGYMSNPGFEDTRQAIADNLNERFGTNFAGKNICMTVGAANALVIAFKILLDPGDEVAVFAPFFLEYRNYISNFGGVTTVVPPNPPTFMPDMDALRNTITEKTKAIVINNPNNPTGVVYDEQTIRNIAAVLEECQEKYGHPIFLVSDEPYRELIYDGLEYPFLTKYYANTMICYSFSKCLSIPGERIGYLLVPDEAAESQDILASTANAIRAVGCVNAPSLQQKAIMKVLNARSDTHIYDRNRQLLVSILHEAGFEVANPQGAFYVFVKTPIPDDKEFVAYAKDNYRIIISSGAAFDCPGYIRMAYCVEYAMIEKAKDSIIKLGKDYGLN
ncbi:MAG: pyridoxal phosphate-dependent aminotransferase [Lachnospiraceae bacterium]|nr:pyridoxal phosphate-dependent aminotransferase [Lachnospiraceae bacterium]